MRLWHKNLIPVLPRQQLLGLHREVCAIRGLSWGKKHSLINYVFNHNWENLFDYHKAVMQEMIKRGYKPNPIWKSFYYRGKRTNRLNPKWIKRFEHNTSYPEHNKQYLISCIRNLIKKLKAAPPGKYNENEIYKFYSWVQENNYPFE